MEREKQGRKKEQLKRENINRHFVDDQVAKYLFQKLIECEI